MQPKEPSEDLLPLLLEICEDYFAHAGPARHHEIDAVLLAREIAGGTGWLIDMLALSRLRLQGGAQTHEH